MMASSVDETIDASRRLDSSARFISVTSEIKPSRATRPPSAENTPRPFSQTQRTSPSACRMR
ncbi:hypothetical protein D3C87_1960650 [compost metagenome]